MRATYPTEGFAMSLIHQAVEHGDKVALSTIHESVTYAELLDRVSELADSLPTTQSKTVQNRPVAVVVDRSITSVVAIMAIRWAGLPILPIAETEPENRIYKVFEQTQPQLVIDATGRMESSLAGQKVLTVEGMASTKRRLPVRRTDPDEISTIFFTSGSTGSPKLVARTNRVASKTWKSWDNPRLLRTWKHVLSFSPLNFAGGFIFGIALPAKGRRVSLLDIESPDILQLPAICESLAVDCMAVTPSMIQTIQKILGNRRLSSIKHVITFGEGLEWSAVKNIRRICSEDTTVQSIYGATETAGYIAEHTIEPHVPIGSGLTPLGTPFDADRIRLEPLVGNENLFEIVVVDNSVENYQCTKNLMAGRFKATTSGVIEWKSHDVVSIGEHGLLHYRGRLDDMIKINGLLVEPAEVERVLGSITGVHHAVLIATKDNSNRSFLIAHLVVDEGVRLNRILEELKLNLPRTLIPNEFVKHTELPLTQRGKVDRTRLRTGPFPRWRMEEEPDANVDRTPTSVSKNEIEPIVRKLQAIWQEELNKSIVDVDVSFTELGGDSLLAVGLLARIESEFKKRCTPGDLLKNQTVKKLAECLLNSHDRKGFIEPLVYSVDRGGQTIFVLPGRAGTGSLPRVFMDAIQRDGTLVVLRMDPHHVPDECRDNFERLAEEFVQVLRGYQPAGPYILMGYCFGGMLAFEIARQLELLDEKVSLLATIDAGKDPVFRWFDLREQNRFAIRFIRNVPHWIKSTHSSREWRSSLFRGLKKLQAAVSIGKYQSLANQVRLGRNRSVGFIKLNDECSSTILNLTKAYLAYSPRKFGGRIVLYRAKTRPLLHSLSPDCGWSSVTKNLEIVPVPGDHRSMFAGKGLEVLTKDLRAKIQGLKQTGVSDGCSLGVGS